jgi:hypothetical protein
MSTGILINRQELTGVKRESFTFQLNPPVGFFIDHVTRISESGEEVDVPVTNPFGFSVTINPLLEKYTFKMCVKTAIIHEQSLHFRAGFLAVDMVFGNKITNLEFINIFSNSTGISYQVATGTNPNWTLVGSTTSLTALDSAIAALPAGAYSVRVNITGFASGSDSVGIFRYIPAVDILTAPQYQFTGISQDIWIGLDKLIKVNSLVSSVSPASSFRFAVATTQTQINSEVNYNITSIAALNAIIAALPANTPYAVALYLNYQGTNKNDLVTFNYEFI